ncbi:ADP-ribosylglycohydrolase family protein [Pseudomonas fluorescens]|nr:ADP-ribosylglycohydrolase family protein [Pseudomonas fluorescens]
MGDSLGLPFENMSKRRVRKKTKGRISQKFLFGRGMVSDDTEHALLTARSLMDAHGDVKVFERTLSMRLRRWLAAFPPGVGKATLLSIACMWFKQPLACGRPSAGNGPLMRAPVIGLFYNQDQALRDAFVKTSTLMTHSDPRALFMASGIADIVAQSSRTSLEWPEMSRLFRAAAQRHATPTDEKHVKELDGLLDHLDDAHNLSIGIDTALLAIGCKRGVDGYAYRSALASAYIASKPVDANQASENIILQGGDTDSTAALTAALCAASGRHFSRTCMHTIRDWPVSQQYLERHAQGLAAIRPCQIQEPVYLKQLARNLGLFWVAVFHIAKSWLPPY